MASTGKTRYKIAVRLQISLFVALAYLLLPMACSGQGNRHNPDSGPELQREDRPAGTPIKVQQDYIRNEVLVRFKAGTAPETIKRIQKELKLEQLRKFSTAGLFLMKISDGSSVESIINRLKSYESVKYAEPNYVVKATQ